MSPPCRRMMRRTEARPTPVPWKSLALCKALEHAEEAVGEAHVEARAVVRHDEGALARDLPRAANAMRATATWPEYFQALPDQVLHRHAQQRRVALDHETRLDLDFHLPLRRLPAQVPRRCSARAARGRPAGA